MLKDDIKKANISALKEKNQTARTIYSIVLNKIMLLEIQYRENNKELTDEDIILILQKTIKELEEEKENNVKANRVDEANELEKQKEILEVYLPKMLSKDEIKDIILKLDDKSIGSVMKFFKANYNAKCDMRLVQDVLKSLN